MYVIANYVGLVFLFVVYIEAKYKFPLIKELNHVNKSDISSIKNDCSY